MTITQCAEFFQESRAIRDTLEANWDTPKRWNLIRRYYKLVAPLLENGERIDPYLPRMQMTPIEQDVWTEIRLHGLPFYPQYPVGRRFVDFGDPYKRIAIEVDGAAYHTPEKDAEKDADIRAEGWHLIRITGQDAYRRGDNLRHILGWYGKRPYDGEE